MEQNPIQKSVSNEWVWLARYAGLKTNFYIAIPTGRLIEVGGGISPQGIPRGARRLLKKADVLAFYGFGDVYARAADHEELCPVTVIKNVSPDYVPTQSESR